MRTPKATDCQAARQPPLRRGRPLVGVLPALRRDVLAELEAARAMGDVVRLSLPLAGPVLLASSPAAVKHMLQTNHANYGRTRFHQKLEIVLGKGLLTADGDAWQRQRRALQPQFAAATIRQFLPAMTAAVAERMAPWRRAAARGEPVDVSAAMSALTLDIIVRCMFGREATDDIGWAVEAGQAHVTAAFWRPIDVPVWLPTPANRRFRRALAVMDAAVARILDGAAPDDGVIGALRTALGPDGGAAAHRLIRDEVMTIMLAGHETSAVGLAWTLDLLARHPKTAAALRAEARSVLGDGVPTAARVNDLMLTRAVVQEAMRLYPSAPWSSRRALGPDRLEGFAIPAGATVLFSPWLLHRDPRAWPEPDRFRPERFANDGAAARAPSSYLPFGAGPRVCVGLHLAMTEMVVVLALLLRDFAVHPVDPPPKPVALVTLRPSHPIRLHLTQPARA